jgi:uncharacterized membrane protein
MPPLRIFARSTYGTERLCALTDGVYAIVLTLLVLDLKPPETAGLSNPELREDLLTQAPNFAAYIIAFLTVGYFWVQHHRLFASLVKCDNKVLIGNLLHLLLISLTPFTASLIGHYHFDRVPSILFSLVLGLASLSGIMIARYALRREGWVNTDTDGRWLTLPGWSAYSGGLVAAVSILVTFFSPELALAVWLVLPLRDVLLFLGPSA